MKKTAAIVYAIMLFLLLSGCSTFNLGASVLNNPLETELKGAARIVFVNNKENTLKFTVADEKVIEQIAGVMGKAKGIGGTLDVKSDYTINFYLPNGRKRVFEYWMGATENNKEINLRDDDTGSYYMVPEKLDVYIVNSTKMSYRPKYFVRLYSRCLSECISMLEKDKSGVTAVGVDVTSDRRMRRYTMSYEDERLFNGISADGYDIQKYTEQGKYTYIISFVTNMYNPDKVRITVEAIRTEDKTKKTFVVDGLLENNMWVIKKPKDANSKNDDK